ncbi:MAG: hypothetical protein M3R61_14790 [Chloroflexota bacterium]|nr:hypothetical protein [Chloroflexota bacterium]
MSEHVIATGAAGSAGAGVVGAGVSRRIAGRLTLDDALRGVAKMGKRRGRQRGISL